MAELPVKRNAKMWHLDARVIFCFMRSVKDAFSRPVSGEYRSMRMESAISVTRWMPWHGIMELGEKLVFKPGVQ